jgi:ATP-dependent Clp protease ATP-binding subunit ClpB
MTSNLGSHAVLEAAELGEQAVEEAVTRALRSHFRPEFLNRIDEVVIFHSLRPQDMGRIVAIQLAHLQKRLADRKTALTLSDEAVQLLASRGYDAQYGARPLKRVIQRELENPLATLILQGRFPEGSRIVASVQDGKLAFALAN